MVSQKRVSREDVLSQIAHLLVAQGEEPEHVRAIVAAFDRSGSRFPVAEREWQDFLQQWERPAPPPSQGHRFWWRWRRSKPVPAPMYVVS